MVTRDAIETAYCFLHQKKAVYDSSHIPSQRDDIECIISDYTGEMNRELYSAIAEGKENFLKDHSSFAGDITDAVDRLEKML